MILNKQEDNTQMKKLKKETISLILCEIVMTISLMFLDTFLVAYFFQLTNQNITIISIYYIITYAIVGIIFWLGGDVIKTKSKTKVFRYGMILNCIYILTIGILGEKCKEFYILLGVLYGLSQGVYWLAAHSLRAELVPFEDTKGYITIQGIISRIIKIVFPIIIGTSIELVSFKQVAIIISILTVIQIYTSTKLKQVNSKTEGFNLLHYMKKLRKLGQKADGIIKSYKVAFYEGINSSLLSTLITIIIVMAFKTSFNLGALTTIFAIISIIANMIYKKYYNKKNAKICIIICTFLPILSVLTLLFEINKGTVIFYNIINAIFITILDNINCTARYNCMNVEGLENSKVEHQSMFELALALGRLVAYLMLFIVGLLNGLTYFKILLFISTLTLIPSSIYLYEMSKKQSVI